MHIKRSAQASLIVALDVASRKQALELVQTLTPAVKWFKVGMELYSAEGPKIVTEILAAGAKVFVDLKFHDIPNTAAGACAAIARLGVNMLNVHCSGGKEMMQRAGESAREAAVKAGLPLPKIIGVTVLTSMSAAVLRGEIGVERDMAAQVTALAALAQAAGLDGVVASPREIEIIRRACGQDFLIVTPGVRPSWAAANDQHRVMTPGEAFRSGATHLVVGRPITAAAQPEEACVKILQEMEESI
ncbi:MAG: orotidine-5'-phosphate decarboxylase [Peptococcaceae bacterium]|nr:orotidine-5'-phosphate decarboxylase [Peptococcaceae bacterium]